jgi:hypothetical protein
MPSWRVCAVMAAAVVVATTADAGAARKPTTTTRRSAATTTTTAPPAPTTTTTVPFTAPAPPRPGGAVAWQQVGRVAAGRALVQRGNWNGVDVFWLHPGLVRPVLVPGTADPPGAANPWGGQISPSVRGQLVAAFNGGFMMRDVRGGYFAWGQVWRGLVPGDASLVIYADGRATVGMWGRDVDMTSDVVAVRQNLGLLVDGGQPVPAAGSPGAWGGSVAGVATARSGVGVDANGALVVAQARVSPAGLADALIAAGAVRGMQMDINPDWVTFIVYDANGSGARIGGTGGPGGLYLTPYSRDFVAVLLKPAVLVGGQSIAGFAPGTAEATIPIASKGATKRR